MRISLLFCLLLISYVCNNASAAENNTSTNTVILISLDGFRPDYLQRGHTPMLKKLADEGARTKWMTPSYPALTFPNHYTLVTGLRPDKHGIIHNTMRDTTLGSFALKNRAAVADGRWWGGEPIWATAQKNGLLAATMFWPGSEAEISGQRPHYWQAYDKSISTNTRVDTVLGWLDLPEKERPRFITLYFEGADDAGHHHGIESPQLQSALEDIDSALTRLVSGLVERDLKKSTNIIVVSDHGMSDTPGQQLVLLDDVLPVSSIDVITQGQSIGIAPKPGYRASAEAVLLGKHAHFSCWLRNEVPKAWHYGQNPRIPPIICQADEGWTVLTKEKYAAGHDHFSDGEHGFDTRSASMRALFIANGPDIKRGVVLAAIENVDVYPMLCQLLGIPALANDGNLRALEPARR